VRISSRSTDIGCGFGCGFEAGSRKGREDWLSGGSGARADPKENCNYWKMKRLGSSRKTLCTGGALLCLGRISLGCRLSKDLEKR